MLHGCFRSRLYNNNNNNNNNRGRFGLTRKGYWALAHGSDVEATPKGGHSNGPPVATKPEDPKLPRDLTQDAPQVLWVVFLGFNGSSWIEGFNTTKGIWVLLLWLSAYSRDSVRNSLHTLG